jgi:hypothetical protein
MPDPPREVRWERLFPDEIRAAFDALPGVYLPYGLCEPHGPHNALGCDGLRTTAERRGPATASTDPCRSYNPRNPRNLWLNPPFPATRGEGDG